MPNRLIKKLGKESFNNNLKEYKISCSTSNQAVKRLDDKY